MSLLLENQCTYHPVLLLLPFLYFRDIKYTKDGLSLCIFYIALIALITNLEALMNNVFVFIRLYFLSDKSSLISYMPHSFSSVFFFSCLSSPLHFSLSLFAYLWCLFFLILLRLVTSAQTLYLFLHCVDDFFTLHFRFVLGSPHFCGYKNINSTALHSPFVSPVGRDDLYT